MGPDGYFTRSLCPPWLAYRLYSNFTATGIGGGLMNIHQAMQQVLGLELEPRDLSFIQISLRAIIVFIAALAMARLANKRFLSKMSAFDAILGFIMASMLARAVNGSAAFFPTLGAGFVLVGVHAMIASLSFKSDKIGVLVKGNATKIVADGKVDLKEMARAKISEKDLLEEARLNGKVMNPDDIQLATLERNGAVSIVPKEK
jgi:uncharacterized membrane protein YcaP (DUF421 family)